MSMKVPLESPTRVSVSSTAREPHGAALVARIEARLVMTTQDTSPASAEMSTNAAPGS
jgi:hypothetical protein